MPYCSIARAKVCDRRLSLRQQDCANQVTLPTSDATHPLAVRPIFAVFKVESRLLSHIMAALKPARSQH